VLTAKVDKKRKNGQKKDMVKTVAAVSQYFTAKSPRHMYVCLNLF
jgi:hypothetical protein